MSLHQLVPFTEESSLSSGLSSPLSDIDEIVHEKLLPDPPKAIKRSAADVIENGSAKKPKISRAKAKSYTEYSDVDAVDDSHNKGGRKKASKVKRAEQILGEEAEAGDPTKSVTVTPTRKSDQRIAETFEAADTATTSSTKSGGGAGEVVTKGKAKKTSARASEATAIKKEDEDELSDLETPKTEKKARKKTSKPTQDAATNATNEAKLKRHRKTREEKEAEMLPLAARTPNPRILLGAHVSAAGGVQNSVTNGNHIGGNTFALFLKSQRKWENPPLKPEHSDQFRILCETHKYSSTKHVVPHGSYLVNLAQADPEKATQAYSTFLDDLKRCETLGIGLYNFHPGNTNGEPRAEAIARIAGRLNDAHRSTSKVVTLLENMAAHPSGNTLGSTFADLRDIVALVTDKSRVGVCLDTCHAFAAGYDLRTPSAFAATLANFDATVGLQFLRAVHVNDSKAPFASHRDLHANIGTGFLGLRAFHNLVNEPRFASVPMVLETPIDKKDEKGKVIEDKSIWAREIKMLEGFVGMDPDGEEFRKLEGELAEQGKAEREKHQEQFDRKAAEKVKKETGVKRRGKKGKKEMTSSSGEDSGGESE